MRVLLLIHIISLEASIYYGLPRKFLHINSLPLNILLWNTFKNLPKHFFQISFLWNIIFYSKFYFKNSLMIVLFGMGNKNLEFSIYYGFSRKFLHSNHFPFKIHLWNIFKALAKHLFFIFPRTSVLERIQNFFSRSF